MVCPTVISAYRRWKGLSGTAGRDTAHGGDHGRANHSPRGEGPLLRYLYVADVTFARVAGRIPHGIPVAKGSARLVYLPIALSALVRAQRRHLRPVQSNSWTGGPMSSDGQSRGGSARCRR